MNKDQIKKTVGTRVRIRPVAKRHDGTNELPPVDYDWLVLRIEDEVVVLSNLSTVHMARIGLDQIHSYMSDPIRDTGDVKHGFLQLRVQLCLRGNAIDTEPLPPGQWEGARAKATKATQLTSAEEALSEPESRILGLLQMQGLPAGELAQLLNIPAQETTFLLERLQERKLIELYYWRRRFPFYRLSSEGRRFLFGSKYA